MDEAELRLNQRLRPLRVEEYEVLARAGAFRDQKVELLRGRVVWMAPQGEEHAFAIELLNRVLVKAFDGLAAVRPQLPFRAGDDSMPEPDFALTPLRARPGPHPAEAFLVVEVAQSSLQDDRLVKAPLYAEREVPEYWILDLAAGRLEVYRAPSGGVYTERLVLGPADTVRPVAFPGVELRLAGLLAPAPPH